MRRSMRGAKHAPMQVHSLPLLIHDHCPTSAHCPAVTLQAYVIAQANCVLQPQYVLHDLVLQAVTLPRHHQRLHSGT